MKLTEGLLKRTFEEIAAEYPDIQAGHIVVDNCAHQLVKRPEQYDVIVTTNMNGDILSDLTSALVGGLGFAPSANLGDEVAIFEAVHGSAPKYAGQNVANPTAVILSAVLMLRHLGDFAAADRIEAAVELTWAEGTTRTRDVAGAAGAASTAAFAATVIANLERVADVPRRGRQPFQMPVLAAGADTVRPTSRRVIRIDIFVEADMSPEALWSGLEELTAGVSGGGGFPPHLGSMEPLARRKRSRARQPRCYRPSTQTA